MTRRRTPPTFDDATELELLNAAEITPADIERAQLAWRRDADPAFRELLDARGKADPSDRRA